MEIMEVIDGKWAIKEQTLSWLESLRDAHAYIVIAKRKWLVMAVDREARIVSFRDPDGLEQDFNWCLGVCVHRSILAEAVFQMGQEIRDVSEVESLQPSNALHG